MLADHRKAPIMAACVDVRWKTREGMGCLLPGRLILTAAHVVKYTPSGDKVYIHHIGTTEGTFGVQPVVIEPMADVAVLSALDDLKFPEEAKAFNSWCDQTPPLHLCTHPYRHVHPQSDVARRFCTPASPLCAAAGLNDAQADSPWNLWQSPLGPRWIGTRGRHDRRHGAPAAFDAPRVGHAAHTTSGRRRHQGRRQLST